MSWVLLLVKIAREKRKNIRKALEEEVEAIKKETTKSNDKNKKDGIGGISHDKQQQQQQLSPEDEAIAANLEDYYDDEDVCFALLVCFVDWVLGGLLGVCCLLFISLLLLCLDTQK
jgi:hypothetical protein